MKKWSKYISIGVCLTILSMVLFTTSYLNAAERTPLRSKYANKTISMDFKNASLQNVLKVFSQQSGLNFVASEEIRDKKITLYFENVKVQDALNRILDANNLTYEYTKDSEIFIVKPTGKEEVETITRIYTLNYATVGKTSKKSKNEEGSRNITQIISRLLSKQGSIISDKKTNSLIIRDIPARFSLIERTIAKLDSRTPQVMIEAEILETSVDLAERIGVGMMHQGSKGNVESYPFEINKPITGEKTSFFGVLTYPEFEATLDMLKSEGRVKYLARPRILSLNNETAKINIASWASIGIETETSSETGQTVAKSAERKWVGTKLKVTPHINKKGFITMEIKPEVSRTFPSNLSDDFLDIFRKSATSKVMVKDGETVVIGGLMKGKEKKDHKQVPFLGDIPVLGKLFSSRKTSDEKTELVIFITPRIVGKETYTKAGAGMPQKEDITREFSGSYKPEKGKKVGKEGTGKEKKEKEGKDKTRSREKEIKWVLDQMSEE